MYPYNTQTSELAKWMRKCGIGIVFIFHLLLLWSVYNATLVEKRKLLPRPNFWRVSGSVSEFAAILYEWIVYILYNFAQESGLFHLSVETINAYGLLPTLYLFILRLNYLLILKVALDRVTCYLGSQPPTPEQADIDISDPVDGEKSQSATEHNEYVRNKSGDRARVHCICIRIVTRGDLAAQKLIRTAVTAAVTLFGKMCHCEFLKAHVVTQTPFLDDKTKRKWRDLGATEIKEFLVPPEYKTPNGTLFKARNLCYWQEMGGVGRECREEESWVLSLDEEAMITKQLVQSFIQEILHRDNGCNIHYASPLPLFDLRTDPIPFFNKCLEAEAAAHLYCATCKSKRNDQLPLDDLFVGGAYFVRASMERNIGNDWGPWVSLTDDQAIGMTIADRQIGIRCLNGWYIHGPTPNFRGWVKHRSRVFLGHIYATMQMPISQKQRHMHTFRLIRLCLTPFVYIVAIALPLYDPPRYFPAGPSVPLLDFLVVFGLAADSLSFVFGAWYTMADFDAVMCTIVCPLLVTHPSLSSLFVLRMLRDFCLDWKRGVTSYLVTPKGCQK